MSALAGNYPGFEEASRALFASGLAALTQAMQSWPADVRNHLLHLARSSDDDGQILSNADDPRYGIDLP